MKILIMVFISCYYLHIQNILFLLLLLLFLMCTCEQHTYTSSEHFHLEEGETMLARGNENFRAPGENRTCDLLNPIIPGKQITRKIMEGILSYEPAFDRKIAENFGYVSSVQEAYNNSSQSLKRDRLQLQLQLYFIRLLVTIDWPAK